MFNCEFAYSRAMQIILIGISFAQSFISMYLIANLISVVFYKQLDVRRRMLFALLTGTLLNSAWSYGFYYLSTFIAFPRVVYHFITALNPLAALLYYFIGIKVLKLLPKHSVRLMGHVYIYYSLTKTINRLMTAILFAGAVRYNYLLDALHQLLCLATVAVFYLVTAYLQRRTGFTILLSDRKHECHQCAVALFFLKTTFVYLLAVAVSLGMNNQIFGCMLLLLIQALMLRYNILLDQNEAARIHLEDKSVHINAMRSAIDDFSGVKHDFYNILQTYQGYLSVGDIDRLKEYHASLVDYIVTADEKLDLTRRMDENPALVTLLIGRMKQARSVGVRLFISIQASLTAWPVENMDLCRIISRLMDNAVEAASASEKKHVFFAVEPKGNGEKLFVITNSTAEPVDVSRIGLPGATTKPDRRGMGLWSVQRTVAKYADCTFHTAYYDYEFSAYLGIRKPTATQSSESPLYPRSAR